LPSQKFRFVLLIEEAIYFFFHGGFRAALSTSQFKGSVIRTWRCALVAAAKAAAE
jgi:hypothetical protein